VDNGYELISFAWFWSPLMYCVKVCDPLRGKLGNFTEGNEGKEASEAFPFRPNTVAVFSSSMDAMVAPPLQKAVNCRASVPDTNL